MHYPALPYNEESRVNDLYNYCILDSPSEKDFNNLAQLAVHVTGCSKASISFIDSDRQWIKTPHPVFGNNISRKISFCAHTILQHEVMVINDTRMDERFFDNPMVTGEEPIIFYAAVPIISKAGFAIGVLSVTDAEPNHFFSVQQKNALKIIASQITKLLDLRLKNKQVAGRSESLLKADAQAAQLVLSNHDKEKQHIASELQENFAQTLATIKFYIEFAELSTELSAHFLRESKTHITKLIKDVRTLTNTIVPSTMDCDNYIEIIREMALQFGKQNNIAIHLLFGKDFGIFDSATGTTIFRIIENQLQIASNAAAKNITIEIKKEKSLCILFTDDGSNNSISFRKKELLFNNTITRAGILKGKLLSGQNNDGRNFIRLKIPLNPAMA